MTHPKTRELADELRTAIEQDDIARAEAWAAGVDATMPLTKERLDELCILGERMMKTKLRRETALIKLNEWLKQQEEASARQDAATNKDSNFRNLRQVVRDHIREFALPRH